MRGVGSTFFKAAGREALELVEEEGGGGGGGGGAVTTLVVNGLEEFNGRGGECGVASSSRCFSSWAAAAAAALDLRMSFSTRGSGFTNLLGIPVARTD